MDKNALRDIEQLLAEPATTLTDETVKEFKTVIGEDPRTIIPEQKYAHTLISVRKPGVDPAEALGEYMTAATRACIDKDEGDGLALRLAIYTAPAVAYDDENGGVVESYINTTYATMIGNGVEPGSDESIAVQALLRDKLMAVMAIGMELLKSEKDEEATA